MLTNSDEPSKWDEGDAMRGYEFRIAAIALANVKNMTRAPYLIITLIFYDLYIIACLTKLVEGHDLVRATSSGFQNLILTQWTSSIAGSVIYSCAISI